MSEEGLRDVLASFVAEFLPHLDCDGCTRFVAFLLENKGVGFKIFKGSIKNEQGRFFPLHYWIETGDGVIFDFKSEKWIGTCWDETIYSKGSEVDVKKFLSVGGDRALVAGVLLMLGSKNKEGGILYG